MQYILYKVYDEDISKYIIYKVMKDILGASKTGLNSLYRSVYEISTTEIPSN